MGNLDMMIGVASNIGGACLILLGIALLCNRKKKSRIKPLRIANIELNALNESLQKMTDEGEEIRRILDNIPNASQTQTKSEKSYGLFSEPITPPISYLREEAENEKFSNEFYQLLNSYPKYKTHLEPQKPSLLQYIQGDTSYLNNIKGMTSDLKIIQQAMEKHHAKVMKAAKEYFTKTDYVYAQNDKGGDGELKEHTITIRTSNQR